MRKKTIMTTLAALLAVGMWIQPSAGQIGISINIGDRPYYEGPSYWDNGYEWIWVQGYQHDHHWIHGHYRRHGHFHREYAHERHHHHHPGH
ncbi:MAG TPA: hypothetical protein VGI85_11775 [Chthoniobacterales bacterium]|jgi:hypothetical protein